MGANLVGIGRHKNPLHLCFWRALIFFDKRCDSRAGNVYGVFLTFTLLAATFVAC